ncbi:MAG: hypothetical protein E6772_01595 [Dysgonomonas sp.]|nr:hypothetical protein [Dysgonomonas sp.]
MSTIKELINLISGIIISGIPGMNLAVVLADGIRIKNKSRIVFSSLILIAFIFSLYPFAYSKNVTEVSDTLFLIFMGITLASIAYSLYALMRSSISNQINNKRDMLFSYLITSILCCIISMFIVIVELVIMILAFNEKKYKWVIMPAAIIILLILTSIGIFPERLYLLIAFFHWSMVIVWAIAEKDCFGIKLLTGKKTVISNIPSNRPFTTQPQEEKVTSRQEIDKPQEHNIIFDKGWTIDDTADIHISLATVEDMINPLPLKNEHEKAVKDLTVYIRGLSLYDNNEISKTFGEKGFSIYLETYFLKIKLDAVRSVYIKSLHLLLEDYSQRDPRVKPYVEKLLVK